MKIFLDCSDPELIHHAMETGLIDGVTTNPSLMLKAGRKPKWVGTISTRYFCSGVNRCSNVYQVWELLDSDYHANQRQRALSRGMRLTFYETWP